MAPAATHAGQTVRQRAKAAKAAGGAARRDRDAVRPLLANPFGVPWPAVPNHLQAAVLAALPQVVPDEVAAYHVSRARCARAVKRARRAAGRGGAPQEQAVADGPATAAQAAAPPAAPPARPAVLDQLVFGLNETIKALEHGIDDLRLRMLLMSDALAGRPTGTSAGAAAVATSALLPTAPPPEADADISSPAPAAPSPAPPAPLAFILVPHLSVSPQALIDPLPVYCATYNTLLRQHAALAAEVAARLPRPERFAAATAPAPPIRLVPLGQREAAVSAVIGLRRVSTFGVRSRHPAIDALECLLPQSVLPPLRHTMTLPFPSSALAVHSGPAAETKRSAVAAAAPVPAPVPAPTPAIQYAPLHVKALHTSAPADAGARKTARMAEVRRKRVENKAKRAAARAALERRAAADIKAGGASGVRPPGRGRAARLAAKAAAAPAVPP